MPLRPPSHTVAWRPPVACIEVPNSLAALGALATGWRTQFHLPLIGVTGSNGKTTVTQMIRVHSARLRQGEPRLPRRAISTTTSVCR